MQPTPSAIPAARELVKLAASDRRRAAQVMSGLALEEQVMAVCEAPLDLRARVLDLTPAPEAVIPLIPEAELCFLCKQVGIHDAGWLIAHASDTQIVTCFDLDAWQGLLPDREKLDHWMATLAEAGNETILRAAQALDPEVLALYIRSHAYVLLKPAGDEDWQPMEGGQTLEGQFYYSARDPKDDLDVLTKLLHEIFRNDYWLYFRMMQSVEEELEPELEEWALRWRTGRLEDLGFPSWDESMRIYGFLRPERFADVPEEAQPLEVSEWVLPVWIPELPSIADGQLSIFRAVAELGDEERRGFFYAFIALANMVAVADRRGLGDADTLPETIEKAASVSSLGLDHIAGEKNWSAADTLRRTPLERLFRVGVNLSPEDVRPSLSQPDDDGEAEESDDAGPSD